MPVSYHAFPPYVLYNIAHGMGCKHVLDYTPNAMTVPHTAAGLLIESGISYAAVCSTRAQAEWLKERALIDVKQMVQDQSSKLFDVRFTSTPEETPGPGPEPKPVAKPKTVPKGKPGAPTPKEPAPTPVAQPPPGNVGDNVLPAPKPPPRPKAKPKAPNPEAPVPPGLPVPKPKAVPKEKAPAPAPLVANDLDTLLQEALEVIGSHRVNSASGVLCV